MNRKTSYPVLRPIFNVIHVIYLGAEVKPAASFPQKDSGSFIRLFQPHSGICGFQNSNLVRLGLAMFLITDMAFKEKK